jgi:hypothetical protein
MAELPYNRNVMSDVAEYEQMLEEFELLADVRTAEAEIDSSGGTSHRSAKAELRRRFAK